MMISDVAPDGPESYLRYVLERIADRPINQIEDLLPWNLLAKMPKLGVDPV